MKLTTKSRFAVTAMIDLAMHQGDEKNGKKPVKLLEISQRQDISLSYLEQLFNKLKNKNLVKSIRGPNGGYLISKDLHELTISDIVLASEDNLDSRSCKGHENCKGGTLCLSHYLWTELNNTIQRYLASISIQDVLDQYQEHLKQVSGTNVHFHSDSSIEIDKMINEAPLKFMPDAHRSNVQ